MGRPLLQKEHALYERVILSQTDREFLVSFCDYMNFLKIDGATLVSGITVENNNFLSEKKNLITGVFSETNFLVISVSSLFSTVIPSGKSCLARRSISFPVSIMFNSNEDSGYLL